MGTLILKDILIIFLVSIPVVLFLRRLRLPSLLGFLATGALIGPEGLKFIQERGQIDILAELGVTLLLFSVGLEFSFENFRRLKRQGVLSGALQICFTILAGLAIGYLLGWSPYRGFYFGCIISLSSTAVVLTTLYHFKMLDSLPGRLCIVILILQDLALIPMMVFLSGLGSSTPTGPLWSKLGSQTVKAILLILFVGLFIRYLVDPLLRQISRARSRELFIITVIVTALGMAWITYGLGLSFALGAFLGGIAIGATEFQYQALAEIKPFRFCFNSLFFVSIGMLFNFSFVRQEYLLVFLLILLIPLLKALLVSTAAYLNRVPLRLALSVGISLGQIGEFSFLLAFQGQKIGVLSPFFYQLIVAISVFAMMITPLMVSRASRWADFLAALPGLRHFSRSDQEIKIQKTSEKMKDHVIICGFGPLGETLGKMLKEQGIPYLILDLNPDRIKQLRGKQERVFFGDGASEEILYESGIERARLLAITVPDFLNAAAIISQARQIHPEIKIITRAKYRNDVEHFYEAGADIVISEELEGGLEMGRYALRLLGLDQEKVDKMINRAREFGSADFF